MNYRIEITDDFDKKLKRLYKKYSSIKNDVAVLANSLNRSPAQGTPLGKDCYKIRMAITSKGKGKSGGARVFTCVKIVRSTIYLLTIIDKSEEENITDAELEKLLSQIG